MDPCKVYEAWDETDRLPLLDVLIQDTLGEWGFDGVKVVMGEAPGKGAPAEYKDGTIYFDLENEEWAEVYNDPFEAMAIAYHETMHAMFEQVDFEFDGIDEFDDSWQEEVMAGVLGTQTALEALEGCMCQEPTVSSIPVEGDAPPFPWVCDMD